MTAQTARISSLYKPLYTTSKRYILITGGRGGLKSTSTHDWVIRLTFEKGHGILFTRYTMSSAETSIIPEFKLALGRLGLEAHFKITRTKITNLHTGSFILFSGIKPPSGDQTAKLKSIAGITTWIIEEGEDFDDEKTFDTIDDSIRTTTQVNRIVWIQNPSTREHFIYQRWIMPCSKTVDFYGYNVTMSAHPDVEHIHTTYHEAEKLGYLNKDWLKKAENYRLEAERTPNKHKSHYYFNYIGGWLEQAEGVIYDKWTEGPFDYSYPYIFGLDLGYSPDPLALVRVGIDKKRKRLFLKQEIYETELDNDQVISRIAAVANRRDLITCDTNEPRLTREIFKAGYNIQKTFKPKNAKVEAIRGIKAYDLIVDPNSHDLKRELNNYIWNDQKASVPIDDWDHLMDAMNYAFRRLTIKRAKAKRRN